MLVATAVGVVFRDVVVKLVFDDEVVVFEPVDEFVVVVESDDIEAFVDVDIEATSEVVDKIFKVFCDVSAVEEAKIFEEVVVVVVVAVDVEVLDVVYFVEVLVSVVEVVDVTDEAKGDDDSVALKVGFEEVVLEDVANDVFIEGVVVVVVFVVVVV